MRVRRVLGAAALMIALGAAASPLASAQIQVPPTLPPIPPPIPVLVVPIPPSVAPLLAAAAPAGQPACDAAYDGLSQLAMAIALVPGIPMIVAIPLVPTVGPYTVLTIVQQLVRPSLNELCRHF